MNWKIRKPTPQEELCYSLEARPYATQEVALKWFSIEGNITSNPKQNAVRNMRNYIKRHRDLQEALAREGYRSYMRSLSPVLVQLIVTHRSKMKVIITPISLEHSWTRLYRGHGGRSHWQEIATFADGVFLSQIKRDSK